MPVASIPSDRKHLSILKVVDKLCPELASRRNSPLAQVVKGKGDVSDLGKYYFGLVQWEGPEGTLFP